MSSKQLTLEGGITHKTRTVPNTLVTCEKCGERILRSRMHDHPHSTEKTPLSYIVRVSQQAEFEIKVDPDILSSDEGIKEQAREKAMDRFYDTRTNLQAHATIITGESATD